MNTWTLLTGIYYCAAIAACVTAWVLFKRGFLGSGVKLSSFVGLTTLKGSVFCALCAIAGLLCNCAHTDDNMAAIATLFLIPIPLAACAILSALASGVMHILPKTRSTFLSSASVPRMTFRVNAAILAFGLASAVIVYTTG